MEEILQNILRLPTQTQRVLALQSLNPERNIHDSEELTGFFHGKLTEAINEDRWEDIADLVELYLESHVSREPSKFPGISKVLIYGGIDGNLERIVRELVISSERVRDENQIGTAIEMLERAIRVIKESWMSESLTIMPLIRLANLYHYQKGYPEQAIPFLEKALHLSTSKDRWNPSVEGNFLSGEANGSYHLGAACLTAKRLDEAEIYLMRAQSLYQHLDFQQGVADCLNQLGMLYEDRADFSKALGFFKDSLELAEQIKYTTGISNATLNINNVHVQMKIHTASQMFNEGERSKALEVIREAIQMPSGVQGAPIMLMFICTKYGIYLHEKNQLSEAEKLYREAIEAGELILSRGYIPEPDFHEFDFYLCQAYYHLGLIEGNRDHLDRAITFYRKAIATDKTYAPTYYNLAELLREQRQSYEALRHYQRFVQLGQNEPYINLYPQQLRKAHLRIDELKQS